MTNCSQISECLLESKYGILPPIEKLFLCMFKGTFPLNFPQVCVEENIPNRAQKLLLCMRYLGVVEGIFNVFILAFWGHNEPL